VAAGILPAVEGGILPPGLKPDISNVADFSTLLSAGLEARLHGRQDACRYNSSTGLTFWDEQLTLVAVQQMIKQRKLLAFANRLTRNIA